MDKADLRKAMMEKRMAMSPDVWRQKSDDLCKQLLKWLPSQGFNTIALFRSFRQEPDLSAFEKGWDKAQLYYPKTTAGGQMEFYPYPKAFEKGRYGIEEPPATSAPLLPDARTVILVPGLAYDNKGYRLGYGGGYYDRFFHRHPCSRLGLCFSDFLTKDLPFEAHDQRVSQVMTELGIVIS